MGLLMAAIAVFMAALAILLWQRERAVERCWQHTEGEIVEVNLQTVRVSGVERRSSAYRAPDIEYQLDGKRYRFTHHGEDSRNPWTVGNSVPLRYDPNNHLRVQLSLNSIINAANLCGFFSIVLGVVAYLSWEPVSLTLKTEYLIALVALVALASRLNLTVFLEQLRMSPEERLAQEPENARELLDETS
ncbi:DUF3592 domain-containing protein [Pseudoteredinibacter isoporae]|uniref:DUF3592 domain-containing protein n=1 Tax=Pseudoteredinibacter isoporae TaxID=570281 RepID=A0A7X0JQQ8_9GAMM|nr:DUF3592 domain-containing protein [Pseudoteredinibacter isoporae]MBB6520558.1 hypothetical protein [Pseudoteredinibacter isoporae]NHO86125.1 DUF3592 domain-containing protein [Pseudoteredinibacter isoporae]NIB25424.1 DUF3592 domain-containing protein [Pseudoteredinibacter isoporae]